MVCCEAFKRKKPRRVPKDRQGQVRVSLSHDSYIYVKSVEKQNVLHVTMKILPTAHNGLIELHFAWSNYRIDQFIIFKFLFPSLRIADDHPVKIPQKPLNEIIHCLGISAALSDPYFHELLIF